MNDAVLLRCIRSLMALGLHTEMSAIRSLSGVKRTSPRDGCRSIQIVGPEKDAADGEPWSRPAR